MLYQRQNSQLNVFLTMCDNIPVSTQVVPTFLNSMDLSDLLDFTNTSKPTQNSKTELLCTSNATATNAGNCTSVTEPSFSACNTTDVRGLNFLTKDVTSELQNAVLPQGLMPYIKEELKYTIQSKRMKEGKEELKVDFTDREPCALSPEEEQKVEKRKVQNRMAARRFRDRQKTQTHSLQKECRRLENEKTELRKELEQVRKERDGIRQLMEIHLASCPQQQFPALFHGNFPAGVNKLS
ncbi:uncharacterized protein LOC127832246 [Dreissena polymorpha]|nr:uncharacterized protein LOC127832246 [Dreissena polymorpha]